MTLRVTMGALRASVKAVGELSTMKMRAAAAARVARLMLAMRDPVTAYDAARDALLAEVGTPVEGTNPREYRINDPARWAAEMAAMDADEATLPVAKLPLQELPAEISPATLAALWWYIDMPEEPGQPPAPKGPESPPAP